MFPHSPLPTSRLPWEGPCDPTQPPSASCSLQPSHGGLLSLPAQTCPPASHSANAPPRHHPDILCTHPPPPPPLFHRICQCHARNQAPAPQFRFSGPNPSP